MASRKKPLITFSQPPQAQRKGSVGILMTCGAKTISLVRDHKIMRVESGLSSGVDRADYHSSAAGKVAYIQSIEYTLPSNPKIYSAKLVDAGSGQELDKLETLTISLIEK